MKPLLLALLLLALPLAGCIDTAAPVDAAGVPGEDAPVVFAGSFVQNGESTYMMVGGCPLVACAYLGGWDFGTFTLDAPAEGVALDATWEAFHPGENELEVSVYRGESEVLSATGPSPLKLDLGAMEAGKYEVRVWFPVPVGAYDVQVEWSVAGEYGPPE